MLPTSIARLKIQYRSPSAYAASHQPSAALWRLFVDAIIRKTTEPVSNRELQTDRKLALMSRNEAQVLRNLSITIVLFFTLSRPMHELISIFLGFCHLVLRPPVHTLSGTQPYFQETTPLNSLASLPLIFARILPAVLPCHHRHELE